MQSEREKTTGKKVRVNLKPWGLRRKRACEWEEDIFWWSTMPMSNGDCREVVSMLSGENSHFCLWVYFLIKKLYTFFNDIDLLNSIWKLNEGFQCQNVTNTICSLLRYPCFDPWRFTCCCSLLVYTRGGMSSLLCQTQVWSEIALCRGHVLPCTCVLLTQVFAMFGPVCINVRFQVSQGATRWGQGKRNTAIWPLACQLPHQSCLPCLTEWPMTGKISPRRTRSSCSGLLQLFAEIRTLLFIKNLLFFFFFNSSSFRDLCSDGRAFLTEEVP